MKTDTIPKALDTNSVFTYMVAQEDFIAQYNIYIKRNLVDTSSQHIHVVHIPFLCTRTDRATMLTNWNL
jgi:hypothetical protein